MYRLTVFYQGFSRSTDERIDKLVGKELNGAGFGLGERDREYRFRSGPQAEEAARRCREAGFDAEVEREEVR